MKNPLPLTMKLLLILMAASGLGSCMAKGSPVENKTSFQFVILDTQKLDWPKGNVYFTWETLWPILKNGYPSAVAYSMESGDIELYDWTKQTITLTPQASEKLFDVFDCDASHQINPYFCVGQNPFIVVLDNVPIYGGEFTEGGSAVSRPYPVIYLSTENGKVVLAIHNRHPDWGSFHSEAGWEVIKNEKIKQLFMDLGKLGE